MAKIRSKRGIRTCEACGNKYKRIESGHNKLCLSCINKTAFCEICMGIMPKYSKKDGSLRKTCSQNCHNAKVSQSPERRKAMSEFSKKLWEERLHSDPEYKRKTAEAHHIVTSSESWKQKRSDEMKLRWMNNDYREKMSKMASDLAKNPMHTLKKSNSMKDRWTSEEYRNNVMPNLLKALKSEKRRELMSRAGKKRAEEYPSVHMPFLKRIQDGVKTNIELRMFQLLLSLGIMTEFNYKIGRYLIDFSILEKKIAIECDGKYWHNTERQKKSDKNKDEFLSLRGWIVIRFSEEEIFKNLESNFELRVLSLMLS